MARYRYSDEANLYNYLYENISTYKKIDNDKIIELTEYLEEDMKVDVCVNAVFDALGFNSLGKGKDNTLNESIVYKGDKVNVYNIINESVKLSRRKKVKVEDVIKAGLLGGLLGGITGVTFGPAVGKAICEALGITRGVLYDLFTSKLVTGAICAKLGLRM